MDPEPDAFLETIKNFASSDFCESLHPELWYWKYLLDDAAWRDQQPKDNVKMHLGDGSDRKRVCSPSCDVTGDRLTDRGNVDILPTAFCCNITDHCEEEEGDPNSTISPSAIARKDPKLVFEDGFSSNAGSSKNNIPRSYRKRTGQVALAAHYDELAVAETNYTGLAAGTHGENRLRIRFESFGTQGKCPQRFGKSGCLIPDGLRGTHEFYDQHWRFEISHGYAVTHVEDYITSVLITWKITNLTSGLVVQVTETPQQAILRAYSGRTVCNKVVQMALSARADELERYYNKYSDTMEPITRISLENNIRVLLRPRVCTVGLLFFGLLHDTVQKNVQH